MNQARKALGERHREIFTPWGEFRNFFKERRFLLWHRQSVVKRMRFICYASGIVNLVALVNDYREFSLTMPFFCMFASRTSLSGLGFVLGGLIEEKNFFSWFSKAFLGYMLLFGVSEGLELYWKGIFLTEEHSPFILIIVLTYYLFCPPRVPFALVAGVGTSLIYLFVVTITKSLPLPILPIFVLYFGFINTVGCATLIFFSRIQRKEFFLLQEQQRTNRALAREIERREKTEASLREMAFRDGLTGLFNYRYFFEQFQDLWNRSIHPVGFLMMDMDYFKRVNDTLGHPAGDAVLVACARRFKKILPSGGVLGRLGGEEFGVVLPECSHAFLRETAAKFRRSVEESPVETSWGKLEITLSLGAALGMPKEEDSPEKLFQRADSALLEAKRKGRNRVCFYPSVQEEPLLPLRKSAIP